MDLSFLYCSFLKPMSSTGRRLGPRKTSKEQGCANHVPESEARPFDILTLWAKPAVGLLHSEAVMR